MGVRGAFFHGLQNAPVNVLRTRIRRGMLAKNPPHVGGSGLTSSSSRSLRDAPRSSGAP